MAALSNRTLNDVISTADIPSLPTMKVVSDTTVTTAGLVEQDPEALKSILLAGTDEASDFTLRRLDAHYARKIKKGKVPKPYGEEILAVSALADGLHGTIALNFCPDLACSTGVYITSDGLPSLVRTLDWGLKMAAVTTALTRQGSGGNWIDITYPGFTGSVTAASSHFAAAINRAPIPARFDAARDATNTRYKAPLRDKAASFFKTLFSNDISTTHLLRQTFEECASFDEAIYKIAKTKTNGPVTITIVGLQSHEAAILYKDIDFCAISTFSQGVDHLNAIFKGCADVNIFEEQSLAAANHWPTNYGLHLTHQRRYTNSEGRADRLAQLLTHAQSNDVFDLLEVSKNDLDGLNIVSSTALVTEMTPATRVIRAVAMEDKNLVQQPIRLNI